MSNELTSGTLVAVGVSGANSDAPQSLQNRLPSGESREHFGQRIIRLQERLADRVDELEQALRQVKTLAGLLPICAYCKRIREGDDYWQQVESYIQNHSDAHFSHGVCPDCYDRIVKPQLESLEP